MANGGGGTVVFGVNDKSKGRSADIVDSNRLKRVVYDLTDPKLMPVFEEVSVPEGSGRISIMHVYPGLPPYTGTNGSAKIRMAAIVSRSLGFCGGRISVETGESDFTAAEIPADPSTRTTCAVRRSTSGSHALAAP